LVIKSWIGRAVDLLFPRRCGFCGQPVKAETSVCERCKEELPRILPPLCSFCGRGKASCTCRGKRRHFQRCVSPFYYEGLAKRGILRLKLYGKTYAAVSFADAMAACVIREYGGVVFDAVVPVPVSTSTLRDRGYNQSRLLASGIAARLSCPVEEALVKISETAPQRGMPAAQRSGNVLGVFDRTEGHDVSGKTLLVVDDILTTGATLDECAKMLKLYGAREIYAVTGAAARLSDRTPACQKGENTV
jgi:competence protein ComFC